MALELVLNSGNEEQVLQVKDEDIVTLPEGLVGFEMWRRFVLLEDPDEAPLGILHCVDEASLSFLVTDPWYVYPDYRLTLSSEELNRLGLEKTQDARVLCTLATRGRPATVTANLLAPIVINPSTKVGRQVILQDSQYSARHEVLTIEFGDGRNTDACAGT